MYPIKLYHISVILQPCGRPRPQMYLLFRNKSIVDFKGSVRSWCYADIFMYIWFDAVTPIDISWMNLSNNYYLSLVIQLPLPHKRSILFMLPRYHSIQVWYYECVHSFQWVDDFQFWGLFINRDLTKIQYIIECDIRLLINCQTSAERPLKLCDG